MCPVGHTLVSSALRLVRKVWKYRIQRFQQRDLLCFFTAAFCILLIHTLSSGQVNYGEEQKKVNVMLSVCLNTRRVPPNLAGAGTLWTCIWKLPDSNFDRDIELHDRVFLCFPFSLRATPCLNQSLPT